MSHFSCLFSFSLAFLTCFSATTYSRVIATKKLNELACGQKTTVSLVNKLRYSQQPQELYKRVSAVMKKDLEGFCSLSKFYICPIDKAVF